MCLNSWQGEGIVGYREDMDLDASAMDQGGERPGEGSLCDSGK